MNDEKGLTVSNGTIRKIIGAAICDLTAYVSSSKDPFITGGQYSNRLLLDRIRMWAHDRKLDMAHPERADEVWLDLCSRGLLGGDKKFDHPPRPIEPPPTPPNPKSEKPPEPKPPQFPDPPLPPKDGWEYGEGDQNDSPAGGGDEKDTDDWKDKKDRKKDWRDEGEDWKKGGDDEKT